MQKSFLKILLILSLFSSCDFTNLLHKRILEAQEKIENQEYSQALKLYYKILEGNVPKLLKIKIYFQVGEIYSIQLSDFDKAIEYYEKIRPLTQDPVWLVKVEEKLGEIYFDYKKNYYKSIESYKKLITIRPKLEKFDYYEFMLGKSYFLNKDYLNANKTFNNIQLSKTHEHFLDSLYYEGLVSFEQKKWLDAVEIWKIYLNYESKRDLITQVKFLMANAYESVEELKKAYDLYYSVLGEYPNTQVVKSRLNAIYERKVAKNR